MEVTASRGKFYVSAMILGGWKYAWNKDGTLSVWGNDHPIHVTTYHGDFLEVVNDEGKIICDGGDGDWFYVPPTKKKLRLRFKKLLLIKMTEAEIDKARRKKPVSVVNQERYDRGAFNFGAGYTNGTLNTVLNSLKKIRASIPKQYRAVARCEIDSESGYEGAHYAHIEVSYERPETDKEVIERVKIEYERARIADGKEREKFKILKSKFCVQ